jgi:hypothetical protein
LIFSSFGFLGIIAAGAMLYGIGGARAMLSGIGGRTNYNEGANGTPLSSLAV